MLAGEIRFAEKVGVAPSTTTMTLGCGCSPRGLGIQCDPVPSIAERNAWIARPPVTAAAPMATRPKSVPAYQMPYASEVEMRGLGMVSPTNAWMTGRPYDMPPGTTALVYNPGRGDGGGLLGAMGLVDPNDQYPTGAINRLRTHGTTVMRIMRQRGGGYREQLYGNGLGIAVSEAARSLTGAGLGTVPNDDELARNLCYTPVHSGWIYGNTPTGEKYYVDGLYGAANALLSDDPAVVADIVKIQRKQMIFQGITTAAIVGMAAASIWGALRSAKAGRRRIMKKRRRGR